MIPLANPRANYLAHQREIDNAIIEVLGSGTYVGGRAVERFENNFAAFIGAYTIGVNSGTDALRIALWALDVKKITVPANTALATVAAIIDVGVIPILVSHNEPAELSVHLHGKASVPGLIEDCAQACGGFYNGQRLGTLGKIGCFSFYPTKNLGAIGDGGMIVTRDFYLAEVCQQTREYGWDENRIPQRIGINSRLDPIQAAVLDVKLKYLDEENDKRRNIAIKYHVGIGDLVKTPDPTNHCFHLYVIECDRRDELAEHLRRHGIGVGIHYPVPIHHEPIYGEMVKLGADLTEVESLSHRILSLPMYPELTDEEVESVIGCIRGFYAQS